MSRADTIYEFLLNVIVIPDLGDTTTFQHTLDRYCKSKFGKKFHGVYSADEIPTLSSEKPYCILNLDGNDGPGSHWIAVAMDKKHNKIIYDSFGRSTKKIIPNLYEKYGGQIRDTEDDAEQAVEELNCGQRCCAWLMLCDKWGTDLGMQV